MAFIFRQIKCCGFCGKVNRLCQTIQAVCECRTSIPYNGLVWIMWKHVRFIFLNRKITQKIEWFPIVFYSSCVVAKEYCWSPQGENKKCLSILPPCVYHWVCSKHLISDIRFIGSFIHVRYCYVWGWLLVTDLWLFSLVLLFAKLNEEQNFFFIMRRQISSPFHLWFERQPDFHLN